MLIPSLPNLPTLITLTGVDDSTDIDALGDLSKRYPLVEWGHSLFTKAGRLWWAISIVGHNPSHPAIASSGR